MYCTLYINIAYALYYIQWYPPFFPILIDSDFSLSQSIVKELKRIIIKNRKADVQQDELSKLGLQGQA